MQNPRVCPDDNRWITECFAAHDKLFTDSKEYSSRDLEKLWRLKRVQLYLFIVDDNLAGYIVTRKYSYATNIEYLSILPDHQGKGYGKVLLQYIMQQINTLITLECTRLLIPFYSKQGFIQTMCPPSPFYFMISKPISADKYLMLQTSLNKEFATDATLLLL